jgi:hypothetical protein
MRTIFVVVTIVLALAVGQRTIGTTSSQAGQAYGLPDLNTIKTAALSPSYSCQSSGTGYQSTALFLSDYSRQRNSPDLLFNGACGSQDYFEAATAGDDMALIADLGRGADFSNLSAHLAFNLQNVHSFAAYSNFARQVPVQKQHTYAVLLNKSDIRGLFLVIVTNHVVNQEVDFRYAVKEYQILDVKAGAPGFDWNKGNS